MASATSSQDSAVASPGSGNAGITSGRVPSVKGHSHSHGRNHIHSEKSKSSRERAFVPVKERDLWDDELDEYLAQRTETMMSGMFKPPPNWASAPPFVPKSMVPVTNPNENAGGTPAQPQSNSSSRQLRPLQVDPSKVKEFVPSRAVTQGSSGTTVQRSALPVKDITKIKEFVPRSSSNDSGAASIQFPSFPLVPGTLAQNQVAAINVHPQPSLCGPYPGSYHDSGFTRTAPYLYHSSGKSIYPSYELDQISSSEQSEEFEGAVGYSREFCPYFVNGECRYGDSCAFLHGRLCEFCNLYVLHPFDEERNNAHLRRCVEEHEKDMELSFAVAHSTGRSCGICYEVVLEKQPPGHQRFGILPSCAHCFCLVCIRRWRQTREFENKVMRGCPLCRTTSDFVVPSRLWVDGKEEKEKLISTYKGAVGRKPCRYFKNGADTCPFGNKCFYKHALPDGTLVDVGPPRRRRRPDGPGVVNDAGIFEPFEGFELESWLEFEEFLDMLADSDDQSDFDAYSDEFDFDIDSP